MEVISAPTDPINEPLIPCELSEPVGRDLAEHPDWILAGRGP